MPGNVLILGGGFAGLAAAGELARHGPPDLSVRLIDRRRNSAFAPVLPDLISGRIRPQHMAEPLEPFCRRLGVEFIHTPVRRILPTEGKVETDAGEFEADRLLLCLGCENNYHGNGEAEEHALGLKTVGEGMAIRRRALELVSEDAHDRPHVVVVGGGYTGFEVASHVAFLLHRKLGVPYADLPGTCPILVVEQADEVLRNCSPHVQRWAVRLLERFGVEVRTGVSTAQIQADAVRLSDGTDMPRAMTAWAAGVTPGPAAAELDAPKVRGGRLEVDENLRLPGTPNVFAAGDVAGPVTPGEETPLRMSIQFSLAGGRHAARNVLRSMAGRTVERFRPFDPGYIVPLAPGQAAGTILGTEMVGRVPSLLHYFMCVVRSWSWRNRVGMAKDLLRPGGEG
ncbi:MAG: FAD-dependent oxidoreductase [Candidatus Brocadiia bacterium]